MYSIVFKRTAVAGETTYQLSNFPRIDSSLRVWVDNVELDPNASPVSYTITTNTRMITFTTPFVGGEKIIVRQGNHYYHQIIRKVSAVFGTMFDEIYVKIRDESNNELRSIKVPLAYGPAQKYLSRIRQENSLDADTDGDDGYTSIRMTLPRMSFELTGLTYDVTRQKNRLNKIVPCQQSGTEATFQYESVPYNLEFTLFIMTKKFDESLQIIEQIVPNFAPSIRVPLKIIDNPMLIEDVTYKLESVMPETNYEGGYEEVEYIQWTLTFLVETNLYRANNIGKLILPNALGLLESPDIEYIQINMNTVPSDFDLGTL